MRSVITTGMLLRSTDSWPELVTTAEGVKRLPLISVSVELPPRLRRLTEAVPASWPASFEPATLVSEPWLTSRLRMTSQIAEAPCASIDARSITCTGEGASSGVPRMNDPVTTTSSISSSCAAAGSASPASTAAVNNRLVPGNMPCITFTPQVEEDLQL